MTSHRIERVILPGRRLEKAQAGAGLEAPCSRRPPGPQSDPAQLWRISETRTCCELCQHMSPAMHDEPMKDSAQVGKLLQKCMSAWVLILLVDALLNKSWGIYFCACVN